MLRHRLAAIGKGTDIATSFGYFFPNPKTEGLRLQWTASELKQGDGIVTNICDLIESGVFPATTDPADCKLLRLQHGLQGCQLRGCRIDLAKQRTVVNSDSLGKWAVLRQLDGFSLINEGPDK